MFMKSNISFVLVVFALVFSSSTWAVPPAMGDGYAFYESCPADDVQYPFDCGDGLKICEVGDVYWSWKEFYNKSGEPQRYWERQWVEGGLFEQGNPDNFLPYIPLNLTYAYDWVADEATYTGVFALINVPGYGQIFHDVGRLTAEGGDLFGPRVFEAGIHQYFNQDLEAVCDYMSGD
jgi:hypothetical protein